MTCRFPLDASSWGAEEARAIQRVLASGRHAMGPEGAACEAAFAAQMGRRHCVMVNSGASAHLLMAAALFRTRNPDLRLSPGDEAIVPALARGTTCHPLHLHGLRLKFVDIDLETLNYDLDQLAGALSDRTRLVMIVHTLGNPNNFRRMAEILGNRGATLLEDCRDAMGASFEGRMAGTFGAMGSFSTAAGRHISTMEGGFVVTDDEDLDQILRALRGPGGSPDQPGFGLRPLELAGAIGVEQIRRLPDLLRQRRHNAMMFREIMAGHPEILIQSETGRSSWLGFSLILRPGAVLTRAALRARLADLGFECLPLAAGPATRPEAVKLLGAGIHGRLDHAEHLDGHGLVIGNHHLPLPEAMAALATL